MLEMLRQLCSISQLHQQLPPHEVPEPKGWRVAVHHSAGLWPGGNYYDFLTLGDGRILFLIADASDWGPASTALALMVRVILHSRPFPAPASQSPDVLLDHLNHVLAENKLEDQFMTAFCGVLDPAEGTFDYANAGHPYPRWWRASHRKVEALRDAAGPPLGTDLHAFYQPRSIVMEPGDLLVFCNDGLTATENHHNEMFGWERLDEVVCQTAPRGAEAVKSAVLTRLGDYLGGEDNPDEITLVVIEREQQARSPTTS